MMPSLCSYYNNKECKSCTLIDLPYLEQVTRKEEHVKAALQFMGQFELLPSFRSREEGFRNRAKISVTGTTQNPVLGITGQENLDQGHQLLNCPIHHPKINELLNLLPDFIRRFNLIPYQIGEKKGELKGLIIYFSPISNQMYLRFVLRSQECVSRIKKLLPELQTQMSEIKCVSANIQPIPHAILEGEQEIYITSSTFIEHRVSDFSVSLSPRAFVQTHFEGSLKLYQTAAQWIMDLKIESLLELFCGQGLFSLIARDSFKRGLGIELNPHAVASANQALKLLEVSHIQFECIDVQNIEEKMRGFAPELILVNPPRKGLAKSADYIVNQSPKHFLYSSCSIESLAQDLKLFQKKYKITRAQVFDLFPHTEHFETLVLLTSA